MAQSCPTLCDSRLFARLLCPWDSPDKNTGVDCHFFLQGIFPTQGSNLGLLIADGIFITLPPRKPNMQYFLKSV